jgi:hypothetical protein
VTPFRWHNGWHEYYLSVRFCIHESVPRDTLDNNAQIAKIPFEKKKNLHMKSKEEEEIINCLNTIADLNLEISKMLGCSFLSFQETDAQHADPIMEYSALSETSFSLMVRSNPLTRQTSMDSIQRTHDSPSETETDDEEILRKQQGKKRRIIDSGTESDEEPMVRCAVKKRVVQDSGAGAGTVHTMKTVSLCY